MDVVTAAEPELDLRERIVAAAVALLAEGGREALTTRAVAAAAGIQAPTIYRIFRDKQGLVDAVSEYGFAAYLRQKRTAGPTIDPVENLRAGWDLHLGFGLANPALYVAMYGDPRVGNASPAAVTALIMLRERMHSLALAGRLRVNERLAADMVRAAICGVVFVLLETPEAERDLSLSVIARETVIAAITTDAPAPERLGVIPTATTLRALLPAAAGLSKAEQRMMSEWLDRLVSSA